MADHMLHGQTKTIKVWVESQIEITKTHHSECPSPASFHRIRALNEVLAIINNMGNGFPLESGFIPWYRKRTKWDQPTNEGDQS